MRHLALVLSSLLAVACGGFEGSATHTLELKHGDIESGTISVEKELDSSNSTWDGFLKDARDALGTEPTTLTVASVTATFDATKAKNVGRFEDVVKGDFVVSFRIKETNEIIDVAKGTDLTGTGSVELQVTTDDLSAKKDKLKAGAFKVGVRSSTDKTKEDDLTLPVVLTFGLSAN